MSSNEMGIEQARPALGSIADRARYAGQVTYLTRNGRRIAAVVPLNRIKETEMRSRASITETPRDRHGNVGMIQEHGEYPTVEQAKGYAEAIARRDHPNGDLHWKQFGSTTWGLMSGQVYTYILVSWLEN